MSSSDGDDATAETLASADQTIGETISAPPRPSATVVRRPSTPSLHFVRGRELARGGMGRVVVAEDQKLGRTVALKLLHHDSPALRARFEREAAITARLAHPAIVPIYEAGELDNGEPFYAMKLVEGTPLDATIQRATTLAARLALLPSAMAVCEALAYAHSRRIIHRDLKPANVLVGTFGETVVIDWGLAKDLDAAGGDVVTPSQIEGNSDVTIDGEVMGTPSYMPPEQATGGVVDERADVYALGALLYHVVAGRPPYRGRTAGEILDAVEKGPPPPLVEIEPDVPDDLASIVTKAMARTPSERYATAGELAEELRRFISGQLVSSHRYSGPELVRRWLRKHRAAVAVAAIAIVVLAIGGAISVRKIVVRERETKHALAESQLEQGRQLFVDGSPTQAAPLLAAAVAELPDDPVARRLATAAHRDADRRIGDYAGTVAAFRRDGRELAIGTLAGAIQIIDPTTGHALRSLTAAPAEIAALEYTPDGAHLAVATTAGAFVIDAGSGAKTAGLVDGPALAVRVLGELVAIEGPHNVTLAKLDGTRIATTEVPDAHLLVTSPDGDRIAVLSGETGLALHVPDLAQVASAPAGSAVRFDVDFDHGALVTAGNDGVKRWGDDPATLAPEQEVSLVRFADGSLLAGASTLGPHARIFSHVPVQASAAIDATHAITGGYDRVLRVWDLARTSQPAVVLDANAATFSLVVAPTGHYAVSRGKAPDAKLELWDLSHLPAPRGVLAFGGVIDWILSDHHDRFAVHVTVDGVQTTRLVSPALDQIAQVTGWPIAFRPHGDELVTDLEGQIQIYSARTGAHLRDLDGRYWHAAFSPSGAFAAVCDEHVVSVRDAGWAVTATFKSPVDISALAVDDTGQILTGHSDGSMRRWSASGVQLAEVAAHNATITELDLRGDTLVTNSWDLSVRRWAYPSLAARGTIKTFDRLINAVGLAPDLELLVTSDATSRASLWDVARGRLLERIATMDRLSCVTFVDDTLLVAGGEGGHLELFDVSSR